MQVRDLIEELKRHDPHAEVEAHIITADRCVDCDSTLTGIGTERIDYVHRGIGVVRLSNDSLGEIKYPKK